VAGFGFAWGRVRAEFAAFCRRLEAIENSLADEGRHRLDKLEAQIEDGEVDVPATKNAEEMLALRISVDRHEMIVQTHDRHWHAMDKRLAVVEEQIRHLSAPRKRESGET
jgi:predicted  nucleic acid-binding Zn-ribbon protein